MCSVISLVTTVDLQLTGGHKTEAVSRRNSNMMSMKKKIKTAIILHNVLSSQMISGHIRLGPSSSTSRGRLEIFVNGSWGTVCDDRFDDQDAMVACRTLGYR